MRLLTAGIAGSVALVCMTLAAAPPALADARSTYQSAYEATKASMNTTGLDIVVMSTSNRARTLPPVVAPVPARTPVRVHFEANPAGESYTSVRNSRTRKLLGAWGISAADGAWATLTTMPRAWAPTFARGRGISMGTAVTGLDGRLVDPTPAEASRTIAMFQLAPPLDWQGWTQSVQADGSTVVTAATGEYSFF
jgi:hypothetical protein